MFRNLAARLMVCLGAVVILTGAGGNSALAEVPHLITYQGQLIDDTGTPLDTVVDITFALFNDSLGTTKYWEETHAGVTVADGLFEVRLGSVVALNTTVLSANECWLGISLDGGSVMQPMTPMTSTMYAVRADRSDTAGYASIAGHATTSDHADTADIALSGTANGWVDDGNVVRLSTTTDSVGIGTTGPRAPLEVQGTGHAIIGESQGSGTAAGVYGANDSNGFGVMGVSPDGRGVTGISTTGFGGHFFGPRNYFSGNLGIGIENPSEMVHIYKNSSGSTNYLYLQSDHPSNWGATGLRFETPQNLWLLRMDDDANSHIPYGAIGLRSSHGGEVMTWAENGDVGIGTNDPHYPLEVVSSGNTLRARCTGSGIGLYASSETGFGVYSDADKNFMGGLTGFGQTNPTHRITVNGAIGLQQSGDTKFHLNCVNGGFNIVETAVADYRLFIKPGGNVGIGTGNPTSKLYVNGNTHVAGIFHADAFEQDAIDKDNIEDEVGIASASGSVLFEGVSGSFAPYLTCEITVPRGGYVMAIGSATFTIDHGITGYTAAHLACSDMPNNLNGSYAQECGLGNTVGAGLFWFTSTCQRLFSVPSQGTYTYYLIAKMDENGEVYIRNKQLRLLYIPSSYASKGADMIACPADQATGDENLSEDEVGHAMMAEPGDLNEEQPSVVDNAILLQQVEALTAKIDVLEGRLQAMENK